MLFEFFLCSFCGIKYFKLVSCLLCNRFAKGCWQKLCGFWPVQSMLCGLSWLNLCDVGLCTRGRLVSVTQQVPSGLKLEKMEAQSSHSFAC